jgi:4-hydroxy-3-methylbut-2-en-1-yl diphosphate synthase IspG/GcpE
MYRDHTKEIQIGDKKIGGGNPVLIQSMCNTKTENVAATIEQIHRLEDAGCDIIRVAVPTMEAAAAIREIKKQIHIPLVADIHFDYRLAIAAIESGAVVKVNVGNKRNMDLLLDLADCSSRFHGRNRHTDNVTSGVLQAVDLLYRCRHILRLRVAHGLDQNRISPADLFVPNLNFLCMISIHTSLSHFKKRNFTPAKISFSNH